jgi:nucleotide-binding universal stress UspA family protein
MGGHAVMKVLVWITEGTWQAAVDTARDLPGADIALLHVIDVRDGGLLAGARAGLLGRGLGDEVPDATQRALASAQTALLDAAQARLGRTVRRIARQGRVEREVVAACADTALLVLARDGDHDRLGPRSIGHHTRFVIDHAPCQVLLVWPDEPPGLSTVPPPPPEPPA